MSTLDELLAKSAKDWTDSEVLQLIEGFRSQRERWNQEQRAGTKKNESPPRKSKLNRPKKTSRSRG
jgi:hypothetical protein